MEDDWRAYKKIDKKKDEALILKGLINGATSLGLFLLKRSDNAQNKTWDAFLKHSKLINTIESKFIDKYKEAKEILSQKHYKLKG